MKKYIIPTVEVTALYTEEISMLNSSFAVNTETDIAVGGGGEDDKSDNKVGQLTNGYGWSADDWSE